MIMAGAWQSHRPGRFWIQSSHLGLTGRGSESVGWQSSPFPLFRKRLSFPETCQPALAAAKAKVWCEGTVDIVCRQLGYALRRLRRERFLSLVVVS